MSGSEAVVTGSGPGLVTVNLAAVVEQASVGAGPYRIDADGAPYVPVGDGGVVLGVRLGDGAWAHVGDHAAPGACLVHADPAAGYALAAQACIGNPVTVRTGEAAGAAGAVIGKRGEGGRVIASFTQDVRRLAAIPRVTVATPAGSSYVFPDAARAPGGGPDDHAVALALKAAGVLVSPGYQFGAAGRGRFRINFSQDAGRLALACDRIAAVLAG